MGISDTLRARKLTPFFAKWFPKKFGEDIKRVFKAIPSIPVLLYLWTGLLGTYWVEGWIPSNLYLAIVGLQNPMLYRVCSYTDSKARVSKHIDSWFVQDFVMEWPASLYPLHGRQFVGAFSVYVGRPLMFFIREVWTSILNDFCMSISSDKICLFPRLIISWGEAHGRSSLEEI